MKWVKIAACVLAALIVLPLAGLAIANAGADSNRIAASLVIHQKPEVVWPWLFKPDKVKQWVTWLVEIREKGEGEPAVGQSSVWVMEDRNNGNAADGDHGHGGGGGAEPADRGAAEGAGGLRGHERVYADAAAGRQHTAGLATAGIRSTTPSRAS